MKPGRPKSHLKARWVTWKDLDSKTNNDKEENADQFGENKTDDFNEDDFIINNNIYNNDLLNKNSSSSSSSKNLKFVNFYELDNKGNLVRKNGEFLVHHRRTETEDNENIINNVNLKIDNEDITSIKKDSLLVLKPIVPEIENFFKEAPLQNQIKSSARNQLQEIEVGPMVPSTNGKININNAGEILDNNNVSYFSLECPSNGNDFSFDAFSSMMGEQANDEEDNFFELFDPADPNCFFGH